ncbi:hypothetical protein TDB9533_00284 [Thalassocella blandensis]|nr:hypothetical protein TDB9533_00284 [Thalassocella blandensis]
MKIIHQIMLVVGVLCCAVNAAAESRDASQKINSKESLRICKSAVEGDLDAGKEIKFRRKTATSVEADVFKHWINATEISDGDKTSVKVLCETSRTGEVVNMTLEEGRWKF